ncbi:MAG: hypothetical protein P8188_07530 [Gemmatimonadota bacterium]
MAPPLDLFLSDPSDTRRTGAVITGRALAVDDADELTQRIEELDLGAEGGARKVTDRAVRMAAMGN